MKNSKKLKLILQVLICILIILIGIVGIYTKSSNMYKNLLPQTYTLGSDVNGTTVIEFKPDDANETVYYDKEGKEVDSSEVTEENKKDYETKEIPVNEKENLNSANYNASLNIMKNRLELLNADQYQISLDEESGIISLSVEDDYIQDIESILPMEARLQLIDSNTEEVILDYTDFKLAKSNYAALTSEYRTYINFKLNDSGIEKINNIDKYKVVEKVEETDKEPTESKIKVMFDSDEIAEVSYNDILVNGKTLRVTTASGLTSDSEINSQINMDTIACKLSTIGKMPVIYKITGEEFVKNDLGNATNYIVISLIAICAVFAIILIFKYKLKGIIAILGFVTNVSLFLIIIRLTKIQISLNSFAGIIGLIVLNMLLIYNILKSIQNKDKVFSENVKDGYLKTLDAIVIVLITFIVFALSSMTVIKTVGLLMFWGWLITLLGTLTFTVPMLSIVRSK